MGDVNNGNEMKESSDSLCSSRLRPGWFRLFRLLPSAHDGLLRCDIVEFELSRAPLFKAISYTCGPAFFESKNAPLLPKEPSHTVDYLCLIYYDGVQIEIPANLSLALTTLRPILESAWIWADAICIQQDDLVERASQVHGMGLIYSSATDVVVWLGADAQHNDALMLVAELSDAISNTDSHKWRPELSTAMLRTDDPLWLQNAGIPNLDYRLKGLLTFLCACRWLSRLWTAQEVILARDATLHLGAASVSIRAFKNVAKFLAFHPTVISLAAPLRGLYPVSAFAAIDAFSSRFWVWLDESNFNMDVFAGWLSTRVQGRSSAPDTRSNEATALFYLARLTMSFRNAACADARDKIFALRALLSCRTDAGVLVNIPVDYTISVEDLYVQVARLILCRTQTLDVLCYTGWSLHDTDPLLPSWVPDYRVPTVYASFHNGQSGLEGLNMLNTASCIDPTASLGLDAGFRVEGDKIHCAGVHFDVVCGSIDMQLQDVEHSRLNLLRFIRSLPRGQYRALERFMKAVSLYDYDLPAWTGSLIDLERSFVAGALINVARRRHKPDIYSRLEIHTELDNIKREFIALEVSQLVNIEKMTQQAHLLVDVELSHGLTDDDWSEMKQALEAVHTRPGRGVMRRRLFKTRRGLLGLGYDTVTEGDQVWVVASSSVPFVLQPTDNNTEFIFRGDCFITGHMHGEILNDKYGLRDKTQDIKII